MVRNKAGKDKEVRIKMPTINIYLDSAETIAEQNQQMRIDDNEAAENISIRAY